MPPTYPVLGLPIHAGGIASAAADVLTAAMDRRSSYACVCNVHMTMEAYDDPAFAGVVRGADWIVPDGMPLVWAAKLQGVAASRVCGYDLTLACCALAAENGMPVGFFGGSPTALEGTVRALQGRFPALKVTHAFSPPMRPPTPEEDAQHTQAIADSGARILFVGLGCPKQEKWMHAHRGRIPAAMLGVGAVFDFLSGAKPHAPRWMQRCGLEWLFRLLCEPRRLAGRYFKHNPRFLIYLTKLAVKRR